ncbi:hypothetical protein BGZ76_007810 [Entomortierella beljakovae]|nr:hypothetical protein BGZ76_007810 [Entomortierella beljakovae]
MILTKSVATFAALAGALVISQASAVKGSTLAISNPTSGTTWRVGESVFLQWTGNCASMGNPSDKSVDVNLMTGGSNALRFITRLASIDCSGNNIRKEFTIPKDAVAETGNYSLMVQTTPPSYSPVFSIDIGKDSTSDAPTNSGSISTGSGDTDASHQNGASSPLKNVRSTVAASAVALAAFFVAAQLL